MSVFCLVACAHVIILTSCRTITTRALRRSAPQAASENRSLRFGSPRMRVFRKQLQATSLEDITLLSLLGSPFLTCAINPTCHICATHQHHTRKCDAHSRSHSKVLCDIRETLAFSVAMRGPRVEGWISHGGSALWGPRFLSQISPKSFQVRGRGPLQCHSKLDLPKNADPITTDPTPPYSAL